MNSPEGAVEKVINPVTTKDTKVDTKVTKILIVNFVCFVPSLCTLWLK